MTSIHKGGFSWRGRTSSKTKLTLRTQKVAIFAILLAGQSLNRFEEIRLGSRCMHSTIAELRKDGHAFHDMWERVTTRYGRNAHAKRYRYIGPFNG